MYLAVLQQAGSSQLIPQIVIIIGIFLLVYFKIIKHKNIARKSKFAQNKFPNSNTVAVSKRRLPNWLWITGACLSILIGIEETIGWEIKKSNYIQSVGNQELAMRFIDHDMPYRNTIEYSTITICLIIFVFCIKKIKNSKHSLPYGYLPTK